MKAKILAEVLLKMVQDHGDEIEVYLDVDQGTSAFFMREEGCIEGMRLVLSVDPF